MSSPDEPVSPQDRAFKDIPLDEELIEGMRKDIEEELKREVSTKEIRKEAEKTEMKVTNV